MAHGLQACLATSQGHAPGMDGLQDPLSGSAVTNRLE